MLTMGKVAAPDIAERPMILNTIAEKLESASRRILISRAGISRLADCTDGARTCATRSAIVTWRDVSRAGLPRVDHAHDQPLGIGLCACVSSSCGSFVDPIAARSGLMGTYVKIRGKWRYLYRPSISMAIRWISC